MSAFKTRVRLSDIFLLFKGQDDAHVRLLASDINANGLVEPLSVAPSTKYPGFRYVLIHGAHRYKALKLLGQQECDCYVWVGLNERQLADMMQETLS